MSKFIGQLITILMLAAIIAGHLLVIPGLVSVGIVVMTALTIITFLLLIVAFFGAFMLEDEVLVESVDKEKRKWTRSKIVLSAIQNIIILCILAFFLHTALATFYAITVAMVWAAVGVVMSRYNKIMNVD